MTQDCQDFVLEYLIEECAPLLARDRELFEELDRMIEVDCSLDQFDHFFSQHVHGYDKKRSHSIDMLKQYLSIGQ
jgi:hypothetical protein